MEQEKLNHKQMLTEIDKLVNNCWGFDIQLRTSHTPEQAKEMANILGRIYSISHCIHCEACQKKYIVNQQKNIVN